MGPPPAIALTGPKIKGGKWTVAKFFLTSVAYTSVWLAVSSELGYYKRLYGPQILLHLNIAYYVPSIPLLIFQSFFDERLEKQWGVSFTILVRLVFGLVGYGAFAAWWPFMPPQKELVLLPAVVALGAFSSVAFSASYQMVARFANKNVIALGLGCSASGPLVLALQVALGMSGSAPTHAQHVALYLSIAGVVGAGLWAVVSLLLRHWDAIEASGGRIGARDEAEQPLLDAEGGSIEQGAAGEGELEAAAPSGGSPRMATSPLPPILAYSLLEPYEQPYLSSRGGWFTSQPPRRRLSSPDKHQNIDGASAESQPSTAGIPRSLSAPAEWRINRWGSEDADDGDDRFWDAVSQGGSDGEEEGEMDQLHGGVSGMLETVRLIWPALIAIGVQAGIALTLFPFFTYVESSSLLGDDLPKVLFFGRIFADLAGRMMPRARMLCPRSIVPVLAVAVAKLAMEPLFFVYLKAPEHMRSDVAVVSYVVIMWAGSGYLNTAANMVAPRMVPPHMKSTAAALMAITYQCGHLVGLSLAVLLAHLMYGGLGMH